MGEEAVKKYDVYSKQELWAEDPEDEVKHDWTFEGTTYAVSPSKAINNVRFRNYGNMSQHKPVATSGHWDIQLLWKAEETEN